MGLHTIRRRKLRRNGIKPQVQVLWDFTYLWVYGAVEPLTGEGFFYEFTHLDTVCFEKFLELLASKYHEDLHIIQVDNVGFHNSLNLSIPENVMKALWASLQSGSKSNRKAVGLCKRTIKMVEIWTHREVEISGAKRVKQVDEWSHCFFDGMAIHFRGNICSTTLGNWYY